MIQFALRDSPLKFLSRGFLPIFPPSNKKQFEFSGFLFFPLPTKALHPLGESHACSEGLLGPLNCHLPTHKRVYPVKTLELAVTSHTPPQILIWATLSHFIPLNQEACIRSPHPFQGEMSQTRSVSPSCLGYSVPPRAISFSLLPLP